MSRNDSDLRDVRKPGRIAVLTLHASATPNGYRTAMRGYLVAMEGDLANCFLADGGFSCADVLAIGAIVLDLQRLDVDLEPFAAARRWRDEITARPAVRRRGGVPR